MGIFGDVSGTDQTITFSRGSGFYHRRPAAGLTSTSTRPTGRFTNDVNGGGTGWQRSNGRTCLPPTSHRDSVMLVQTRPVMGVGG